MVPFSCVYSNGVILTFPAPVSWRRSFSAFKFEANLESVSGRIYAGERFVRSIGCDS